MHRLFDIPNTRIGITQTSSTLSAQASNLHPTDEKIMQARAQVNEVMDLMRENIGKLAKRGERLDNLAERAEALEAGTNDFYKTAVQVKRDRYWKAYSMYLAMLGTFAVFVIAGTSFSQQCNSSFIGRVRYKSKSGQVAKEKAQSKMKYSHTLLVPGMIVQTSLGDPLKIMQVIHYGEFGDIYEVEEPGEKARFCLRTETKDCPLAFQSLDKGIRLTQRYSLTERRLSRHAVECAKRTGDVGELNDLRYYTYELLGPNLDDVRRYHLQTSFDRATAYFLCGSMTRAIGELQRLGYTHRRLSPKMFCLGNSFRQTVVYLVGYSHLQYVKWPKKPHKIYPPGFKSKIRGDKTFHSLAAHRQEPVYFRDDLESLVYAFIDIFKMGAVPWKKASEEEMINQKMQIRTGRYDGFQRLLPPEFQLIFRYLRTCDRTDRPDYTTIYEIIDKCAMRNGIDIRAVVPDFCSGGFTNYCVRPAPKEISAADLEYNGDSDQETYAKEIENEAKLRVQRQKSEVEVYSTISEKDSPQRVAIKAATKLRKGEMTKQSHEPRQLKIDENIFLV